MPIPTPQVARRNEAASNLRELIISFRQTTADDIGWVNDLIRTETAFLAKDMWPDSPRAQSKYIRRCLITPGTLALKEHFDIKFYSQVIMADNELIGYLGTVVDRGDTRSNLKKPFSGSSFILSDIYITPKYRGRGIGGKIIRDLIEKADKLGMPVALPVTSNNKRAIQLYQRLGFNEARGNGASQWLRRPFSIHAVAQVENHAASCLGQ